MSGRGAREKALQFLREVPRLSHSNIKGLPKVAGIQNKQKKIRGRGQQGYGTYSTHSIFHLNIEKWKIQH